MDDCDETVEIIYDDEQFFNNYIKLRSDPNNYNDLIERPNIMKLVDDIRGKTVLDIGCGFGSLSIALAELRPKRVVAIDNSIRMLGVAERINSADNLEYIRLDANDLLDIGERFDVVCSALTFHYIGDFSSLIKNIASILKPNGQLIFSQEHPILTAGEMVVTASELSEGIHIRNYSLDGERRVEWLGKEIIKYHRKFSTIFDVLEENGFDVNAVVEPIPPPEIIERNKQMLAELQRPSYLMIKATKRDGI